MIDICLKCQQYKEGFLCMICYFIPKYEETNKRIAGIDITILEVDIK